MAWHGMRDGSMVVISQIEQRDSAVCTHIQDEVQVLKHRNRSLEPYSNTNLLGVLGYAALSQLSLSSQSVILSTHAVSLCDVQFAFSLTQLTLGRVP